jgi:hypothetical protein
MNLLKNYYLEFVSIFIFISSFNLAFGINYIQNDEWVYYQNIEKILSGNFELHPKTAPTFYTISFLAYFWSLFFSINSLPVLTLVISVLTFYFFSKTIEIKFNFSKLTTLFLGLILGTNIIFIYSSFGFMTENYLLFFLILSLYFFEKHLKESNFKFLHLSNLFSILSFFVKQSGIIFLIATSFYFLLKKDYQKFIIQIIYSVSVLLFYFLLFPKTSEMVSKNFSFINFDIPFYLSTLVIGILIYLVFFTLPIVINFIYKFFSSLRFTWVKVIIITSIIFVSILAFNYLFKPQTQSNGEFPYFRNIFQRTGFFPKNINGLKYQFRYNYDFFLISDYISKFLLLLIIPAIILKFKKLINVYSISLFGFFVLMLFTNPFYDRYLLYALPLVIMFFLTNYYDSLLSRIALILFVIFQIILSYTFMNDYFLTHKYLWNKSQELRVTVPGSKILVTDSWGRIYGKDPVFYDYIFSFDNSSDNSIFKTDYRLIETYEVNFWGNLFIEPKIYLYQKIEN